MPPRIIPVLDRLRQDIAAGLSGETIEEACRQAKHRWRDRVLDPATTISLFLLQVLHGNTACRHVVHFGGWALMDSASCQTRKRFPLAVYHGLVEQTAPGAARWLGHRVWVVDGSNFSMPNEPGMRRHFGQPGGQREGRGFPVAKWPALFGRCHGHAVALHDGALADPRHVPGSARSPMARSRATSSCGIGKLSDDNM